MISFEKLLVCVDLSTSGQNIIEKACTIAINANTKEIAFLYIVTDLNIPESVKKEFPEMVEGAIEEKRKELETFIENSLTCKEVSTKIIIKQGNLTKEILTTSEEEGTDLIVIGRKEDSDSVLNTRIARRATCNLLILPRNTELSFDKILVPVDFSNYTDLSLNVALKLTNKSDSEIFLHNVYSVPSSYRYSGKSYEEFAEILEDHAAKDLKLVTKKADVKNQKLKTIHTNDQNHNVIDIIYNEAKSRKIDMIVMGAKGRTAASALFIGSKAERMIQINNDIPLLVIRKKGMNAGILESLQEI